MPLRIHPIRHAKEVVCLETPLNSDGLDIPHYRLHLIAIYNRVILDIEGLHMTTNHPSASVCDFECVDTRGDPFPLNQFAGQPFLIVNTASLCSFSSQFKGLALYHKVRSYISNPCQVSYSRRKGTSFISVDRSRRWFLCPPTLEFL
jgi:hypothetical protein